MSVLKQAEFITQTSGKIVQDFPWIKADLLPENRNHGASDLVLVCVEVEYAKRPWVGEAFYDYRRGEWWDPAKMRKVYGTVTHWGEKPAPPREYRLRELNGVGERMLTRTVDR